MESPEILSAYYFWIGFKPICEYCHFLTIFGLFSHQHGLQHKTVVHPVKYEVIYPSHGYTALVANEICKKYQAVLAFSSSLGTYRCM